MTPVWALKLQPGDSVKGHEPYGPIKTVHRAGIRWIATLTSGKTLAYLPWKRATLANR